MKFDIDVTLASEQFDRLSGIIDDLIKKEVRKEIRRQLKDLKQ